MRERHVSNHRTDNDKFVDISALKKRRLPGDPALLVIGCFLDLNEHVGPLYSWNYTPEIKRREKERERERRGGVCFDWIVGPNCGTHSEEEKEGGDESSLKEIRINREEREGLEACVVDACTVIICGTHFFSLLYFFVCVGTHLVCCKSPRGALFDWNCFLKDSSLSLSPKQKCFTA